MRPRRKTARSYPYWRRAKVANDQAEPNGNGPAIARHSVASSAVSVLVYDRDRELVWVTFTDGSTYELDGFSEIELARWLGAASIGRYFNANVRGRY